MIAGATKPEQIEQNVAARPERPSPDDIAEIDAITHAARQARALIIGGSVGGLFAANMLRSIGWDATVFERNPEELPAAAPASARIRSCTT